MSVLEEGKNFTPQTPTMHNSLPVK